MEKVRINIGHDGIMSASDLIEDIRDYSDDIKHWFSNKDSDFEIHMHHEKCEELGCILYCLDVLMEKEFVEKFRNLYS